MSPYAEILNAARRLSPADRLRLAGELWDNDSVADWPLPSVEWLEEVRQRSLDFDRGLTTALTWNDVRQRARQEAGLHG